MCDRLHVADLHLDVHVKAEAVEYPDQPIDRKAIELCATDTRKIRGRDTARLFGCPNRHLPSVEHADDPGSKRGFEMLDIRVGISKIAEQMPGSPDHFHLIAHRYRSFSVRIRSRTRSISCLGVEIPDVDFFWNACTTQMSSPICRA